MPESKTFTCTNCGLAPPYRGFDDCLACGAAALIVDSEQLVVVRRLNVGTPWLATLDREIERQHSALVACGHQVAA